MLFNMYSSLADPLKKVIDLDDPIYVPKLTTDLGFPPVTNQKYVHIYLKCRECYRYQKTFPLI